MKKCKKKVNFQNRWELLKFGTKLHSNFPFSSWWWTWQENWNIPHSQKRKPTTQGLQSWKVCSQHARKHISPPPVYPSGNPSPRHCILLPKAGRQNILQHIAAALNICLLNEDDCSFLLASIVKPNYPSNMHSALFCLPVSLFCCGRRSSFILNFKVHPSPRASLFSSPVSSLSKLRFSRFSPKPLLQKNGKVRWIFLHFLSYITEFF